MKRLRILLAAAGVALAALPAQAQHHGGSGHGGYGHAGHGGWGHGGGSYGHGGHGWYGAPYWGLGVGLAVGAALSYPAYYDVGYPAYAYGYGYAYPPQYAYPPPAYAAPAYACGTWFWHPDSRSYSWAPCAAGEAQATRQDAP